MAKRKSQTKQIDPAMPVIPPIPDAPGPEADADALDANYRLVQTTFATHAYDDIIYICHWCLVDAPLPYAKVSAPRSTRMYCSKRCAEAYDAYMKSKINRERAPMFKAPLPSKSSEPVDDSRNTPPEPTPVKGGANGEPVGQTTEIVGEEGQGRTEWQPVGQRPRKKRNGNGRGKKTHCVHDHELTGDNVYHHPNGTDKCRQCQTERLARMRGGKTS